jgi:hypothetical protein
MSVVATICAIGLALIADQQPSWASHRLIAQLNAIGGWIVPVVIFCSLFAIRLLLAPYWLWREMAEKVALADAARPQIIAVPMRSTVNPQLRHDHTGQWRAAVDITVHLENRGSAEAHNYEIAAYSCWLKNPTEWDKWADQFFARWPVGGPVEFAFSQSKIAEDQGGRRMGFSAGDELIFVIEIAGRVNVADGIVFNNEQIWLSWDPRSLKIVPPNSAIVDSLRSDLLRFKASIPN